MRTRSGSTLWRLLSGWDVVAGRAYPRPARVETDVYAVVKQVLDSSLALVLLVFALPVIAVLGALVKLTSRGPMIYAQVRAGLNGKPFRIYKLRTMVADSEVKTGPTWAKQNDPRVTRLGRFLRASHLDELPQLFNVLKGDMSLVGPRPERPEIIRELEEVIPNYRQRMTVRPGVTGLAQVHLPPDVDLDSVRRKVVYDAFYIQRLGLWLDLRLMLVTGLKLFGLPYPVSCRLLAIPSPEDIEREHRRQLVTAAPAPLLQSA
jgi:lipopolysaccharide/colanic/teichoic acid biosynthesis glycosyltransferase